MSRLNRQASLAGALAVLVGYPTLLHGGVRAEKDTVGEGFSTTSGGQIETLNRATYIRSVLWHKHDLAPLTISSLGKACIRMVASGIDQKRTRFTQSLLSGLRVCGGTLHI